MKWFKKLEEEIDPDCVIDTGGHGYWRPKSPIIGGFNMAHFIYPESPFFRQISLKKRIYWKIMRNIHLYFYNRLDAILVQTNDVKNRLEKALSSGAPIYVVSNTVNGYFLNLSVHQNKLPPKQPGEIRLLTVSSYYPHKNLDIIKPVVRLLEEKGYFSFRFVLTLPDDKFQEEFGAAGSKMILNVGPVPIKECPSLYSECDFMFLPTLLECFSASYVEAMIMRKPILTSDMSFARTICQDAAAYFDPMEPEDITDKLVSLSGDPEKQDLLISNGNRIIQSINSPHERARKYLEFCEEISG